MATATVARRNSAPEADGDSGNVVGLAASQVRQGFLPVKSTTVVTGVERRGRLVLRSARIGSEQWQPKNFKTLPATNSATITAGNRGNRSAGTQQSQRRPGRWRRLTTAVV